MTLRQNSAEGGSNLTNATSTPTNNTGGASGDALSSVAPGAGGAITFSSTQAAHGSLAYALAPAAAAACTIQMTDVSNSANFTAQASFYFTGYPSAESVFFSVQSTPSGVDVARLHITPAGVMKLVNTAGTTIATFSTTVALNTYYRITLFGTVHATTGSANASLYLASGGAVIEAKTVTNTNTGSANAFRSVAGKISASPSMAVLYIDDFASDMASATELGPFANTPPTCTAAVSAPAAVSTTFTLTGTDADVDGTIASRLWTCTASPGIAPSITNAGTATATFSPTDQGKYVFNYHVVDDDGATADATCTAWAYVTSGSDSTPIAADVGTDGWTAVGGTAIAVITDSSSGSGLQPPGTATNDATGWIELGAVGPGDIVVYVEQVNQTSAKDLTADIYKADGTTLIATRTWQMDSTLTEHAITFDSGENTAALAGLTRQGMKMKLTADEH